MKKNFLIQGTIQGHARSVWIRDSVIGSRYQLPVDEYAKRYKEKFGLAATLFEWAYIGSGPNFLSWALGVELVGSNITEAQSGYIHDKIIGEVEHGRDFELTLEL